MTDFEKILREWKQLIAKMADVSRRYAKILFCNLHLLCNLAGEFNGLVSKRAGCFYIRPFYAPLGPQRLYKQS